MQWKCNGRTTRAPSCRSKKTSFDFLLGEPTKPPALPLEDDEIASSKASVGRTFLSVLRAHDTWRDSSPWPSKIRPTTAGVSWRSCWDCLMARRRRRARRCRRRSRWPPRRAKSKWSGQPRHPRGAGGSSRWPRRRCLAGESEFDEGDDDTAIDEALLHDETDDDEEPADAGSEGPAGSAEHVEGGAPVSEEDKAARAGRQPPSARGRRGGRDGEERPPQAGEPRPERAPQTSEPRREEREPRRQPDPDPRDRGARGGRRPDAESRRGGPPRQERREPAPVEVEDDTPPRSAPAIDAADDTDFSNWDVPSWQDLIASLYRPDR